MTINRHSDFVNITIETKRCVDADKFTLKANYYFDLYPLGFIYENSTTGTSFADYGNKSEFENREFAEKIIISFFENYEHSLDKHRYKLNIKSAKNTIKDLQKRIDLLENITSKMDEGTYKPMWVK